MSATSEAGDSAPLEQPSTPQVLAQEATPTASVADAAEEAVEGPLSTSVTQQGVEEEVEEEAEEPAQPTISPEQQKIQELELDNTNLAMRLERREKECDGLRDEVADLTGRLTALKRDNDRLEAKASDAAADSDTTSELRSRIYDLEDKLREVEAAKKPAKDRRASTQHLTRIKELEKELEASKRTSVAPSTSSISMNTELRKAQGEIAQLRAALMEVRQPPTQHVASPRSQISRGSQPRAISPEPEVPANLNSRASCRSVQNPRSSHSPAPLHSTSFLPGDRVLAWWEPSMGVGPKGWGADSPGWYPAVVVPYQSTTHVAVDWGGGTSPSTVPRCNVKLQQLVDTAEEAAKLSKQMSSPARKARQESVRQASQLRTSSPTPVYDAIKSVSSRSDAVGLANSILAKKTGTTGTSSFSVIGQLSPREAKEAARRILEWELVKEGSYSPRRSMSPANLPSASPRTMW